MNKPKASVIIAVYNNTAFLDLVLQGLARQSMPDFEVIIAEDADSEAMTIFVSEASERFSLRIQHVCQPDDGFRKCAILNEAIRVSLSDYLIFIDGDCVVHQHFVQAHVSSQAQDVALYGRRVMMSEPLTKLLLATRNLSKLTHWNLFRYRCQRLDAAWYLPFLPARDVLETGIWGCNWSITKAAILAINGFDEDYITAGIGEDTDLEWRLQTVGVRLRYIKFRAIQYHLYHRPNYVSTQQNEALLKAKKEAGLVRPKNGLEKK